MKILNDWKDFFAFLKQPDYLTHRKGIISKSLLAFSSFILNILLISLPFIIYGVYLNYSGDVPKTNHENVINLYHPVVLFTMVAIFEEFSFRSFLTKFNPVLFSISISGIIAVYFKKIVFANMMFEPEGLKEVGFLILVLFPILLLIAKKYNNALEKFWKEKFKFIVYISAFLFAFVHFLNSTDLNLTYLPTTLIQLISAFILTFVRVRSGIAFAIVLHFIFDIVG